MDQTQNTETTAGDETNLTQQSLPEHTSGNESAVPAQIEQSTDDQQNNPFENRANQNENRHSPMEVHHPHHLTHKKKWSEYLLEFLMLFLAVFLGFIAENIREISVERHREKEYIRNMVQNLKDDTAQLNLRIPQLRLTLQKLDSLAHLAKADLTVSQNLKTVTRLVVEYAGIYYPFMSNNATIVQLKSGNLRLIQTSHAADSILKYDYITAITVRQQEAYNNALNEYVLSVEQVFDVTQFLDTTYVRKGKVTGVLPQAVTTNKEALKLFSNKVAVYFIAGGSYLRALEAQSKYAKRLIDFLKKEYGLDDE